MAPERFMALPRHAVLPGGRQPELAVASFNDALTSVLPARESGALRLQLAFGGTSALGQCEQAARSAYGLFQREHAACLANSQLLVIDGATRAGHIVFAEEMVHALQGAAGEPGAVASFGVTSAAAFRDPDLLKMVSAEPQLFNQAHAALLVVDTPEGSAGWGFETPFFMEAARHVCHWFRSAHVTGGIHVAATFVNGGEVSAKELVYSSLTLPYLAQRYGADTEIVVVGGSGRVASQVAHAYAAGEPMFVYLRADETPDLVAEITFGEGEIVTRISVSSSQQHRLATPQANHLRCSHPLDPVEAKYLTKLARLGHAHRCRLRVL